MPKYVVLAGAEQDALFERRHLLPPSDAATALGVSRQAVDKSAARPQGQLLAWTFAAAEGGRRYRNSYVDFGPRTGQLDPGAWLGHRDDPAAIIQEVLHQTRQSISEAARRVVSEPSRYGPAADGSHSLAEDDLILRLVASGVVQFDRNLRREPPVLVPYPDALQKGLDKLTVQSMRRATTPPRSVPDLLAWCRERPLNQWPLDLSRDIAGPGDRLLDGPQPTAFCQEWAVDSHDVESEVIERQLLHHVIASCRQAGDQVGYVAFRTLLIEKPVLTTLQLHVECARPELSRLAEAVRSVYVPAPLEYADGGMVTCCATCGNLLFRSVSGGLRCENDRCARRPTALGRRIPLDEDPLWLELPFRTFVSAPGQAELRLAERLERLGLEVERWPDIDAYDLRVTFRDGEAWAVDVKDWASPVALARHLNRLEEPFRPTPSWRQAFFVFPQERLRTRPDYVRAFAHSSPVLARSSRVRALGEAAFVAEIRQRLETVAEVS
jgi:hypothetical protein